MMKYLVSVLLLALATSGVTKAELKCQGRTAEVPDCWLDMEKACVTEVRRQIQMEVNASYTYLSMGAYFSRDEVNMPGFAKHFFDAATEERSHALHLIEYLLMRGPEKSDQHFTTNLLSTPRVEKHIWANGLEAMRDALVTETEVTKSIKRVIKQCEDVDNHNDYHLVDYLTAEFLDEQYKGQRDLAGKISTLSKMIKNSGPLGLFLFDKELLA